MATVKLFQVRCDRCGYLSDPRASLREARRSDALDGIRRMVVAIRTTRRTRSVWNEETRAYAVEEYTAEQNVLRDLCRVCRLTPSATVIEALNAHAPTGVEYRRPSHA